MSEKISWSSPSGQVIEFDIFSYDTTQWNSVSGIYMFCALNQQNQWEPLYIGQTDSFLSRLPNHEKWVASVSLGAQAVLATVIPTQASRDLIERQLIQHFQPLLNKQLR